MRFVACRVLCCLTLVSAWAVPLSAAEPSVAAAVSKGVAFLKTTQADDGSWTSPTALGITALATHALLVSDVPVSDAAVQKGLKKLESAIQSDGGIYDEKSNNKNYETAIALLALTSANGDGRYQQTIERGVAFLKKLQWDEEEVGNRDHLSFGGAGYGRSQRPDLSNTAFFLEALKAAGVSSSDPAVQNALVFVTRCQNLEGPQNQTPFSGKINDGGFFYTPAAGGSSMAGNTPDGGLRSYASMTYAGLKSMLYAGLNADDPRVQAAQSWIRKFYSLEENPGMGQQGLFYYYVTFAKTMTALGQAQFADATGQAHDWRKELTQRLLSLQKGNGSWVNPAERWLEGDPNLTTAYALLALNNAK